MTFVVIAQCDGAAGAPDHDAAIAGGVDAVEIPVRCSSDDVAVVAAAAVCGDAPLHELPAADPRVRTLTGLLATLPERVEAHLLLRSAEPELIDAVRIALTGIDPDRIQIVSVEPALLLRAAHHLPDVLRGLIVSPDGADEPAAALGHRAVSLARLARADRIHLVAARCDAVVLGAFDQQSLDVQARDADEIDRVRELHALGLRRFSSRDVSALLAVRG